MYGLFSGMAIWALIKNPSQEFLFYHQKESDISDDLINPVTPWAQMIRCEALFLDGLENDLIIHFFLENESCLVHGSQGAFIRPHKPRNPSA